MDAAAEHDEFLARAAIARGYLTPRTLSHARETQVRAEAHLGKHFALLDIFFLQGVLDESRYAELLHELRFAEHETQQYVPELLEPPPAGAESSVASVQARAVRALFDRPDLERTVKVTPAPGLD